MKKNLYALLGLTHTATEDDIRAAVASTLAQLPEGDGLQRMAVKEAASVLTHAQRRAAYDASLHAQAARQTTSVVAEAEPPARSKAVWLCAGTLLALGGWLAMRGGHHKATDMPALQAAVVVASQALEPDARPAGQVTQANATLATARDEPAFALATGKALSPQELFAQASASVVRVNVVDNFSKQLAVGSGVVIDRETVITNCHVAKAGPRLLVKQGEAEHEATITLADEAHDLCKLAVSGLGAPAVSLGSVSQLQVGQKVYAIGSPQGLDLTLSDGMVSSLRETPEGSLIQTSAPISPGSSGGGLFTEQGQLVGIVTFQMRTGQNLNFALPVDWIGSMHHSTRPTQSLFGGPSPTRPRVAVNPALLGSWHCFGPLTGRGLDATFEADGTVHGQFEGRPIGGRYSLVNMQLNLMGNSFLVESLTPSSMVLSKGQGRRLSCSR
jgi:serine protease Do